MYRDRLEYLKRRIKRTYKCYTGERQDGEASLKDVADFFNIPIDESRLDDYTITKIDYNKPSIELLDKKTSTTYISEYTSDANLLNYGGCEIRFNSLLIQTPKYKIDRLYYIGNQTPIIEQVTVNNGDYDLVFERQYPNNISFAINDDIMFTINYLQRFVRHNNIVRHNLLTKIYKDHYSDGKKVGSFEQLYTYSNILWLKLNGSQDKYTYVVNNNVIYGIDEFYKKNDYNSIKGICFESTDGSLRKYFPINMSYDHYTYLKDKNNKSAMLFTGFTKGFYHSLEIYKRDSNAYIRYRVKECKDYKMVFNEEMSISLLRSGNISNDEIKLIMNTLQGHYSDDEFIDLASCELESFGNKIDIKNGVLEEEIDMLNPKQFINQSFDDIAEQVNNKKDEFFSLISDQFEAATNINPDKKKEYVKELKSTDSQNN